MRLVRSKNVLVYFTLLWMWLFSVSGFAASTPSPLPADQAFVFSVNISDPQFAMVSWHIAPGYYLYSKRVQVNLEPKTLADIRIPQGDLKYDANQGRLEVFSGSVSVPIQLKEKQSEVRLNVDYQGCSEGGFCYPPVRKTLLLNFTTGKVSDLNALSLPSLLTDQNGIRALFGMQHFGLTLLIFAGLGLLLSFTPCVLPMIPIITSIIVGHKQSVNTMKGFSLSSTYVFGSAVMYALAGIAAALMGSSLQVWLQKPLVIGLTGGLFVILALSLFGLFELKLPARWQNTITHWSNQQRRGNYIGVFFMGLLSTLIVSPCVTAPLVGVLMYISQTGDVTLGGGALFAMGIGMGIPLILIGMSAGRWLPKSGEWMNVVKKMFGLLMLGMAIWLTARIVMPWMTMLMIGVLLLGIAVFLNVYLPRLIDWHKLSRALGVCIGLVGVFVIVGASMPNFSSYWMGATPAIRATSDFTIVRDVSTLNKQLMLAQASHKPVMLDFYADWCESCIVMDKNVFAAVDVKRALSHYVLLRADLTSNSAEDQAIMKQFNVIAPPTVLFFNVAGNEMSQDRIVGEVNAKEFLGRLDNLWNQPGFKK